ncbi:MAG: tRNA (adenosine(37)-N6)-threonylcarbamoyltransferase complex dimerization subunit type 1 TsaB [Deltaproteobacteria bacterium]|nr:tRNA (adenosine(37)-N6)-threonylcarbamoyltransferase complex dimerization subunit type 1 TsaB [Deltaproteobacteria bacterium]
MLRLVIDTSTSSVSLGILSDEGWLECIDEKDIPQQQSKVLFNLIQKLFEPLGIEKKEITEIAIGQGPGSYTGLRMGMTVAKVWSFAQKIPLYTFSSAELLKKTKQKEPTAEYPQVKYLELSDYKLIEAVNDLEPIYENDHFAKKETETTK